MNGSDIDTDTDTDADTDADTDTGSDTDGGTDECDDPNVVEDCAAGWCSIPPGCFTLGSPVTEPCRGAYSEIQVEVTLTHPFLIKQTEVTRVDWVAVGFPDPSYGSVDPCTPVNVVNWFDALAYCNALSEAEGLESCYDLSACTGEVGSGCPEPQPFECDDDVDGVFECPAPVRKFADMFECPGYRLPTTAEWEYAARAGTTTATYLGEVATDNTSGCVSDPAVDPIAWHCGVTDQIMPVGLKEPNCWGLYDMLGNAMEWTDYVYTGLGLTYEMGHEGPYVDPIGASEDEDPRRSARGGYWSTEPCNCRSADHLG